MINSMTGFGKAEVSIHKKRVTIEIASVNNRFLEISIRLPKIFSEFESDIREAIGKLVSRGKLSVSMSLDDNGVTPQMLMLNEEVARLYYKMFRDLKTKFKLAGDIEVSHFTGLPELFSVSASSAATRADIAKLIAGVKKAVTNMNNMREKEGKALARDMVDRVKKIEVSVERVGKFVPQALVRYRDRLQEMIQKLQVEGAKASQNHETKLRLDMEVAIMADKADVTEECVRLNSHCEAFIEAIKAPGDTGKRLNFILQEMNREANTIGSKSILYETSAEVINIREEIEKLREQVQNIE